MKTKISIADDHPMVIEGIKNMLRGYKQFEILSSYQLGSALLEGLKQELPNILLLDLNFPDSTGNDLVRVIKPLYPRLKIIAVTAVEDPWEIQDMMQHGCSGYIRKTADKSVLVEAIQTVIAGDSYVEQPLKEVMLNYVLNPIQQIGLKVKLSDRELEVLQLISEGLTNMEIADRLYLSHRTIGHHRVALYEKFKVNNAAALIKSAVLCNIIR